MVTKFTRSTQQIVFIIFTIILYRYNIKIISNIWTFVLFIYSDYRTVACLHNYASTFYATVAKKKKNNWPTAKSDDFFFFFEKYLKKIFSANGPKFTRTYSYIHADTCHKNILLLFFFFWYHPFVFILNIFFSFEIFLNSHIYRLLSQASFCACVRSSHILCAYYVTTVVFA